MDTITEASHYPWFRVGTSPLFSLILRCSKLPPRPRRLSPSSLRLSNGTLSQVRDANGSHQCYTEITIFIQAMDRFGSSSVLYFPASELHQKQCCYCIQQSFTILPIIGCQLRGVVFWPYQSIRNVPSQLPAQTSHGHAPTSFLRIGKRTSPNMSSKYLVHGNP